MSHLIAIAALDIRHVLGLRALLGQVLLRTAVAATTRTGRMGRAILGEVTHYRKRTLAVTDLEVERGWHKRTFVALATLDSLG